MAKVKRKYTPIGDEWIPANEAVAQLARYHASRTKRLFAYDGDGLAELQLAIQCGYATCGLLCRSDGTQERSSGRPIYDTTPPSWPSATIGNAAR